MWYRRLIRWAFARLYQEFAWTYDAVAWAVSGGLWRRWALAALPELRGRVLELGFGTGHVQLALARRPAVAGLDASPQMTAITAARLRRGGAAPRLVRGHAQALPFADTGFDTVLATFPSEYLLDAATQAEIRRILAPGGRLVVVPLAQLNPSLLTSLVDLLYRLTLQTPVARSEAAAPQTLTLAGLSLEARWVPVGPSRVALLTGEMPR